jgi:hypothetical protein
MCRDANYAKQTEQQQLKIKRSLERSQAAQPWPVPRRTAAASPLSAHTAARRGAGALPHAVACLAQAPVIKKTGKPTMARSAPPVLAKKTASGQVSQDGEEEDVSSFFKDD